MVGCELFVDHHGSIGQSGLDGGQEFVEWQEAGANQRRVELKDRVGGGGGAGDGDNFFGEIVGGQWLASDDQRT